MKSKILRNSLFLIALFILINNFIFFPGNILSWDVFGYYLYLPLKFIYHDLGLQHPATITAIIEKYNSTATFYQALEMPGGSYVMKYPMGLAFFYAPFFFSGHILALVFNYPTDGFSLPYQYSIFIGGIFYSILGIWVLAKVLLRFFNEKVVLLVLIIIIFSTNYLVHITMYGQNAMSHNYLFMTYALILWFTIKWHETYRLKYILMLAIVSGLSILSRPSEIVCLVIPALWGVKNWNTGREKLGLIFQYKKQLAAFIIVILLFGLCQFIYWKIYTGKFLFYSYGGNAGEGFEFLSPHLLNILFSFRKGWLIYTPVMIFAIVGFYFIYLHQRNIFYALFLYFILNLFIVSSWSTWWYASSFSQRSLIPSYPVMAIGLGYFLSWLNRQEIIKAIFYMLISAFLFLNLFQSMQFHYGIIDGERMTGAYYWKIFGKINISPEDQNLLLVNRAVDSSGIYNGEEVIYSKRLAYFDFENSEIKDSSYSFGGKYSFRLDSLQKSMPCIESPYYGLTNEDHAWVKATACIYPMGEIINDSFRLSICFNHNGYIYNDMSYGSERMNLKLNQWNKITFNYLTPEVRRRNDKIKICFLHQGSTRIYIDNFQLDIYERRK